MKKALGRGLGSLLPDNSGSSVLELNIDRIVPHKEQPRRTFKDETLKELAQSIKEKGIIQPVIVTRSDDGLFTLIAGERRWRAAKLLGMTTIPALIKDVASEEIFELALIENIQREDLNPIETAEAFQRLMNDFEMTQDDLSSKVGKDRATISNYVRLLKLPSPVRGWVSDGLLSVGHAKAILQIKNEQNQIDLSQKIIKKGLSVRETEKIATKTEQPHKKAKETPKDPEIRDLEQRLTSSLGAKVLIHHRKKDKRGRIEIQYHDLDELDRLLAILSGTNV
jgi:ParB family chromosome partitioning protein